VLLFATTTGYQIRSFGEAAEKIGVRLIFASDRCDQLEDPWWDGALAIRFHEEQRAVDIVTAAFVSPPAGILAVGDRPTVVAARAAQAFGLPWHSPRGAAASRNKLESRRALSAAGLPAPVFRVIPFEHAQAAAAGSLRYPVVVKPLALSGSRGVIRADDDIALGGAVRRLRRLLLSPDVRLERDPLHDQMIIESFIPGSEFALEGVLAHGALIPFALFDKPDPLDGPYFEETIYVTPSRAAADTQRAIIRQVAGAAHALGLWHGPIHAECRVNADGVFVLEVAARPIGGLCSRAVALTAPDGAVVSLEEVLLRHAIGEDVSQYRQTARASGVMMMPVPRRGVFRGVDGVDEARAISGVKDVVMTARPDSQLVPLPEGRSYLGFIFATGETPQAAEEALRSAHARLRFRIDREVALVPAGARRR
jgi:biotin carboxylase